MGQNWSDEPGRRKRASSDCGHPVEFRMPYILQATLGKGKNGVVYMAELTETSAPGSTRNIVVKTVPLSHKKRRAKQQVVALRSEIDALVGVGVQENLVKYFGWNILAQDEEQEQHAAFFRIFMEYCEGGTLQQRARKGLRYAQLRDCIRQVLLGLAHLHSYGIVHGDLTTTNIFLTSRSNLRLKIGGFGKLTTSPNSIHNAPETHNKPQAKPDPKSDIWNVALILIELLHEGEREEFSSTDDILQLIGGSLDSVIIWFLGTDVMLGSTHLAYFAQNRKVIECLNFLKSCLQKEPSLRPSATALLNTPHLTANLDEVEVRSGEAALLEEFTVTQQMSEWIFQGVDNKTGEKVVLTKRVVELVNWMDEFVAIATVVAFHGDLIKEKFHPQMLVRTRCWACRDMTQPAAFVEKLTVYSRWDYGEPCALLDNVIANGDGGFRLERVQNYANQLLAMLQPIWHGIESASVGSSVVVLDLCTAYLLLTENRTKLIMLPFLFPEVIIDRATKDWFIAANIWDLGILVLTMLTGKVLLEGREAGSFSPVIPEGINAEVRDFLRRCFSCFTLNQPGATSWIREAGNLTWSVEELIHHPFVTPS